MAGGSGPGVEAQVHSAAEHGVQGGGGTLPHLGTIQHLFGRHDVSGVSAHVGGPAAEACQAMNAQAYATGTSVAFAGAPDLHTAAHEAAHVVQQRGGVQLKGGVGEANDQYEHHADAVADAVVAGTSAQALLDQVPGGGAAQAAVQRKEASEATPDGSPAPADQPGARGASPLADLAQKVGSAGGLRAALAANPALGTQIASYLAATDDGKLNQLMSQAFPPGAAAAAAARTAEVAGNSGEPPLQGKNPTDPTVALPANRTGNKALTKGQMIWTLKAVDQSRARVDVDFKPDKDKVDAKNVSFLQTVIQQAGADRVYPGGTTADPSKEKARFTPLEDPASKKYIDHLPAVENDPFYGAEWDQAAKKWKKEPGAGIQVGSSVKGTSSTSAKMNDTPNLGPVAREGKGDASSEFETVPVVLETREPLGALKWGFKIKDAENAPLELTGGQDADCTDTPSADWGAAVTQYYAGKYETILDEFDIAKSDLKPDHKTKLDGVVTKMTANAALNVELGGACDHTGDEAFNQALSLKRAEAARDYLVSKGIDAGRITVQSYSFDWARVEAEKGKSEGKNRRVQVLLR
jgi:outer membrane protein OmpA-like peptidoglycan-associated protein